MQTLVPLHETASGCREWLAVTNPRIGSRVDSTCASQRPAESAKSSFIYDVAKGQVANASVQLSRPCSSRSVGLYKVHLSGSQLVPLSPSLMGAWKTGASSLICLSYPSRRVLIVSAADAAVTTPVVPAVGPHTNRHSSATHDDDDDDGSEVTSTTTTLLVPLRAARQ